MKNYRITKNRFFSFPVFLLLIAPSYFIHEEPPLEERGFNLEATLDTRVLEFTLNNETIGIGLKRLASATAGFALGFEHELRPNITDPPIPDQPLTLHLKMVTVRETLDAMCRIDGRYIWSRDDTFVNVYPIETVNDSSYLLNQKLKKLDLNGLTDIQQGLLAIVNQLPQPQEQVAIAQIGGTYSYPAEPWTTSYDNITVRQAIK